jgi:hypothetical protein
MVSGNAMTYEMERNSPVGVRFLDQTGLPFPKPKCPASAERFLKVL